MDKRILSLMLMAVALVLAGLGHYYLLYQRIYVWDAALFYVVAAFLMVWAYRCVSGTPERSWELVRAAWRRLRAALRGLLFRRPTRMLVVALAVANGLAALIAFLAPPPMGLLGVLLLWTGGVVALGFLIPWDRWAKPESAPVADAVTIKRVPPALRVVREKAEKHSRVLSGLFLIVGLGFAFLGQFYFFYRREHVWEGVLFWCVAILSFGLLSRKVEWQECGRSSLRCPSWGHRRSLRTLGMVGGLLLSALAGWLARRRPEMADFGDLLWLWLLGVAWFLLAFAPPFSVREAASRLTHWFREHRVELAGLMVLLLAALVVRAVDLEHIPVNLGGEEGTWGLEGLAMLDGRLANPFSTGWVALPSMSFLVRAVPMRIFGETVVGVRVLSVLLGAATVWTTFLLARELWGRRVAWLAAILLVFGHYHIHYSRVAINNIADGLFFTLALYLLVRGLRSQRPYDFALAGAVMGLGWYGYFGARLIGIIAALYLTGWMIADRRFLAWQHWRLLLVLLGAALVVSAPLLLNYAAHPLDFAVGSSRVSIFGSGWLAREQEITGRSVTSLLLQQFWKSVSAFNYTLDPTFVYRPSIPLLDFVSGVLFILGMVWTTAHCRRPANGLLLLWFWLSVILGWVVTENPPSSQRMIGIAPALALSMGLGLNLLMELGQRVLGGRRRLWAGGGVLVLAVVAVLNLHYYFVTYTPTRVYGNPTAEVTTDLARYLVQQDDNCVVYFYGQPWIYWDFGTLDFMAQGVDGVDIPPPGEGEAPVPDITRGARFVFIPMRLDELDVVRARYPGGTTKSFYSTADGRVLFTLYEVALQ